MEILATCNVLGRCRKVYDQYSDRFLCTNWSPFFFIERPRQAISRCYQRQNSNVYERVRPHTFNTSCGMCGTCIGLAIGLYTAYCERGFICPCRTQVWSRCWWSWMRWRWCQLWPTNIQLYSHSTMSVCPLHTGQLLPILDKMFAEESQNLACLHGSDGTNTLPERGAMHTSQQVGSLVAPAPLPGVVNSDVVDAAPVVAKVCSESSFTLSVSFWSLSFSCIASVWALTLWLKSGTQASCGTDWIQTFKLWCMFRSEGFVSSLAFCSWCCWWHWPHRLYNRQYLSTDAQGE